MRKSRRCWLGDLANVPHGRRRRERAAGLPRAAREPDNERSHLTTVRLYDCTAVRAVPLPPFRTVSVKGLRNGTTRLYVYAISTAEAAEAAEARREGERGGAAGSMELAWIATAERPLIVWCICPSLVTVTVGQVLISSSMMMLQ